MNSSLEQLLPVCSDDRLQLNPAWIAVVSFLYIFVGISAIFGNLSVLLIVILRSEMQTVTNLFITSVSFADLVIASVSLWVTPLSYYHQKWNFGKLMCHLVPALQGSALIWVPFTLTAIAVDRYMLVAFPFAKHISIKASFLIIFFIFLSSFVVLSPQLFNIHYFEMGCYKFCLEDWRPFNEYRFVFGVSVFIIRSVIPLTIITICHWKIAQILNSQTKKFTRMNSVSSADLDRKTRLHSLLKSMVVIFAVSSIPLDVFNILQDVDIAFKIKILPSNIRHFYFFFSHWIAMSGTLLNPLVYAFWNENFRRQIKAFIGEMGRSEDSRRGIYSMIISARNARQNEEGPTTAEMENSRKTTRAVQSQVIEFCEELDVQV